MWSLEQYWSGFYGFTSLQEANNTRGATKKCDFGPSYVISCKKCASDVTSWIYSHHPIVSNGRRLVRPPCPARLLPPAARTGALRHIAAL